MSSGPLVVLLTVGVWLAMLWAGWTLVFTERDNVLDVRDQQVNTAPTHGHDTSTRGA